MPVLTKLTPDMVKHLPDMVATMTLQEIGDMYGVSRERIRQVLKKQGIAVGRKSNRQFQFRCTVCKKWVSKKRRSIGTTCANCVLYARRKAAGLTGNVRRKHEMSGPCERCHKRKMRRKGLCNSCYIVVWRQTHPAYAAAQRAKDRQYYQEHKEELTANQKIYYKTHRLQRNAYARKYYHRKKLAQSLGGGEKDADI